MTLARFIYPIDFTARNATNLASNEEYTIGVGKYRTIVPNKGAIYADSIILKEKVGGKLLKRGTDYECLYTYTDLIRQASGKEVVGAIVIYNESAKADLVLTYQFVGGPFSSSALAISQAIEALNLDDRDVLFENLINVPDYFIAAPHVHDIGDVFGFEYIINMLASIREAVLIGDNAVNSAIKTSIEALEVLLTNKVNAHLADMANPHGTTAHQTGAYDYAEIDNELARIATQFSTVAPQFASLIQQIQTINNEIGAVNGVLTAQSNKLNSYQNSINSLDLSLTAANQRLAQAESDISDLGDEMTARKNEINGINTTITGINQTLATYNTRINSLEGALPGINTAIQANTAAITAVGNRTGSLETRTGQLETAVETINSGLGNYVDWVDVVTSSQATGSTINNKILRNISHVVKMPRYVNYYNNDTGGVRLQWSLSYNSSIGDYTHYCNKRINVIDVYIRSDIRDKVNVSKITPEKANDILTKIGSGIRYQLKSSRKFTAGISAQQVQKFFKEAVVPFMDPDSNEKRLTVTQSALIGLLFSGYQYLTSGFKKNSDRIKKLEKLVDKQSKLIDKLVTDVKNQSK